MVIPTKSENVKRQTVELARIISRRKTDDEDVPGSGGVKLARVLGLTDLTALGVGSTLGVGVYVLAGAVAKDVAGPAVTISFLIAAIASAFSGLCYAEFASRVPKAGSAYVYSYVTVGELSAFIIGWNLILEYVIGTASVARGLSNYVDSLLGNVMRDSLTEALPLHVSFLSPYPDFLSCGVILILSLLLAWGVKESTMLNNIFTLVNLGTVVTVIVSGLFKASPSNWTIPKASIPPDVAAKAGNGGFLPFGVSGVMAGAAKCFYGFVGFDCVATTGEEAKNPKRDIPLSIVLSLIIIFLSYFGIATVLTMMWPYYDQDADAPLPYVFDRVGLPSIKMIVSAGAIFALCTSVLCAFFCIPRILYSMGRDGLLFAFLGAVHPSWFTPANATYAGGIMAGVMAAIFNLEQLIDMMSIGTLLAYTIVSICVLLLRYRDPNPVMYEHPMNGATKPDITSSTMNWLKQVFNLSMMKYPSRTTEIIADWTIALFIIFVVVLCVGLGNAEDALAAGSSPAIIFITAMTVLSVLFLFILYRQPQAQTNLAFKVPWVPLIPCLSILMNFYLMVKLDYQTWIRFGIWLFLGMLIYIFYSIPNSVEGIKDKIVKEEMRQRQTKAQAAAAANTNTGSLPRDHHHTKPNA